MANVSCFIGGFVLGGMLFGLLVHTQRRIAFNDFCELVARRKGRISPWDLGKSARRFGIGR